MSNEPVSKHRDGWCGEPCPACKGTGEAHDDLEGGRRSCKGCGGTGERYESALDERKHP